VFGLKGLKSLMIDKLEGPILQKVRDEVAVERPISLCVNDKPLIVLMASPLKLKALAIGHLLTEGILNHIDDIKEVYVNGFEVNIVVRPSLEKRLEERSTQKIKFSLADSSS